MHGVPSGTSSWSELMDNEEHGWALFPIMILVHEQDPDPAMHPDPIPSEKRDKILQRMIAGITAIYRYFEPYRRRSIDRISSLQR